LADRKYNKFDFGFLNVAQDQTEIGDSEATELRNLDPDQLALGSLVFNDQSTVDQSGRDYLETTMAGRRFFLGDYDPYSEFDGNGHFESSSVAGDQNPTFNFGTSIEYTFAFEFRTTSTGFIIGNGENLGVAASGEIRFDIDGSGDLYLQYYNSNSATTGSLLLASSVNDGAWHKVVALSRPSRTPGATDLRGFFDGRIGPVSVTLVHADSESEPLFIGGNTVDGNSTVDLRNIQILKFACTSPAEWTGTLRSLGFGNGGDLMLSTPNGSGTDNQEEIEFTLTGTFVAHADETKQVGPIRYEVNPDGFDFRTSGFTKFRVGTKANEWSSAITTEPLSFDEGFIVAIDLACTIQGNAGNKFAALSGSTSGTATDTFEIGFDTSGFYSKIYLPSSTVTTQEPNMLVPIGSKSRARIILHFYRSGAMAVVDQYFNGEKVVAYEDTGFVSGDPLLMDSASYLMFHDDPATTSGFTFFQDDFIYNVVAMSLTTSDPSLFKPELWDGSGDYFDQYKQDDIFVTTNGNMFESRNGENIIDGPNGYGWPIYVQAGSVTNTGEVQSPLVAQDVSPTKPEQPTIDKVEDIRISNVILSGATLFEISEISGKSYDGPESLNFDFKVDVVTTAGTKNGVKVYTKPTSQTTWELRYEDYGAAGVAYGETIHTITLGNNLQAVMPPGLAVSTSLSNSVTVQSTKILDGKYIYKCVGVRVGDTKPAIEVKSTPTDDLEIEIKNLDEAGDRIGNFVPVLTIPPVATGGPDYLDRIDIYRKDPDGEEFVKVGSSSSTEVTQFTDGGTIGDLPKIEFLAEINDENFETINDAIGNDAGTFDKLFNKDNRLWVIPTDRQDLLMYSRAGDFWGWRRENSFSFNGDIVDTAIVRDPSVVSGELTLVVFTTKGIYHIIGLGTEASPYTLLPVIGGDDFTNIDVYPGSVVQTNGVVMFLSRSTDGEYDTGPYGQKVYEYDLQNVTEVSGRVRGDAQITGTSLVNFASFTGGDKYLVSKEVSGAGLLYHKDARGWLNFNQNASNPWRWKSKTFNRRIMGRGNPAFARMFKVDYEGDITMTFGIIDSETGNERLLNVNLSSVARTTLENVMPAGMADQWYLLFTGEDNSILHNFWFVQ